MIITYNGTPYQILNSYTMKAYIYWDFDNPYELIASNIILEDKANRYYLIWNNNGNPTMVPQTDIEISFSEGTSRDLVTERIIAFGEKNSINDERFTTLEVDINGIKTTVGKIEKDVDGTKQTISQIEQKNDEISASVENVTKEYNLDKELQTLRDNVNIALLDLQSTVGTFLADMNTFMEDNRLSDEEAIQINDYKTIMNEERNELNTQIDNVLTMLETQEELEEVTKLTSQKELLNNSIDNLLKNIDTVCTDKMFTNIEMTTVVSYFSNVNTKINETNTMIDDYIFLQAGGKLVEKLANLKINQNEIVASVSKVETDVVEINDNMESLTNRVTSAEQKITDEAIINTVSQTYTTKTEFNNLNVGGRNLLLGTSESKTFTGRNIGNQTFNVYTFSNREHGCGILNETITLSYSYSVSKGATGTFYIHTNGNYSILLDETSGYWQKLHETIDVSVSSNGNIINTVKIPNIDPTQGFDGVGIRMDNFVGSVTISNFKLEKGNKATDWSPAPEDVQGEIDDVANNLAKNYSTTTQMNSIIAQKANEITSMVSETYTTKSEFDNKVETMTSNWTQTASGFEARILQNEKSVSSLKLTNKEFEVAIGNKADSSNIISTINASTERIAIDSTKVNISGFVTFSDLYTSGKTTISGDNINSGTIRGVSLQTYADSTSKGVRIEKESMYLNGTKFLYETADNFRIAADQTLTLSSPKNIYLMAGLVSNTDQSGTGEVIIPEATLRTQRLNVVNNASISGACSVSGQISCSGLSAVNSITCANGYTATNGGITVTGRITTTGGSITAAGSITGNNVQINTGGVWLGTTNQSVTASYVKMGTGGYMAAYSGFHFIQSNGSPHTLRAGTIYSNGTSVLSDKRLKTDIKYVNIDEQTTVINGLMSPNVNITTNDMHEFIETLPMVSYRLIEELNDNKDNTHYGFLAQEIMYSKVGSELIEVPRDEYGNETDGYLRYSENKFIAFICGALQEEIKLRKELQERVVELENKLKEE